MTSPTLSFRAIQDRDLEQVNSVEQRSAEHPWRKAHFADCLKTGYTCELVEIDHLSTGAVGHSVMMTTASEASILILTVDKKHQGQGIGRKLLQHMMHKASQSGCETILLEVRKSNHKAFNLYLHEGFSEIGVRRNYYPMGNNREDAIVMAMELYSDEFDLMPFLIE